MKQATRWLSVLLALLVCSLADARAQTLGAGAEHSVVVTPDGHVWTWGRNENGQLGDGTTTDHHIPAQVPGLPIITAVATNTYHTLALANDRTVYAWGGNWYGQVGNGTTTNQPSPVHLSLTNIVAISVGNEDSFALGSSGTVWWWGGNYFAQLGRATSGRCRSPGQNSSRSPNCHWRMTASGAMLVILAAVPGQSTHVFGLARFTLFVMLNDSARNCALTRSVTAKFLKSERSNCEKDGPSSRFRPTVPNVPRCGRRHGPSVCPFDVSGVTRPSP